MPRPLKRSFKIGGHRTSISLEAEFWDALRDLAVERSQTISRIVQDIDNARRPTDGLSSAVRVWILHQVRHAAGNRNSK